MDTIEADQIIKQYLEDQEHQKQLQLMQLHNDLNSFTTKQLKKEIIAMKADKLAVTKIKGDQLINLIITCHWLFPQLIN